MSPAEDTAPHPTPPPTVRRGRQAPDDAQRNASSSQGPSEAAGPAGHGGVDTRRPSWGWAWGSRGFTEGRTEPLVSVLSDAGVTPSLPGSFVFPRLFVCSSPAVFKKSACECALGEALLLPECTTAGLTQPAPGSPVASAQNRGKKDGVVPACFCGSVLPSPTCPLCSHAPPPTLAHSVAKTPFPSPHPQAPGVALPDHQAAPCSPRIEAGHPGGSRTRPQQPFPSEACGVACQFPANLACPAPSITPTHGAQRPVPCCSTQATVPGGEALTSEARVLARPPPRAVRVHRGR